MPNGEQFEGGVPIRFLGPNTTAASTAESAFNAKSGSQKPQPPTTANGSSTKYNKISKWKVRVRENWIGVRGVQGGY